MDWDSMEGLRYMRRVMQAYRSAHNTPKRITLYDIDVAEKWHDLGVPCYIVERAIGTVACRTLFETDVPPIRSLAYYAPLVMELHEKEAKSVTDSQKRCTDKVNHVSVDTTERREPHLA